MKPTPLYSDVVLFCLVLSTIGTIWGYSNV